MGTWSVRAGSRLRRDRERFGRDSQRALGYLALGPRLDRVALEDRDRAMRTDRDVDPRAVHRLDADPPSAALVHHDPRVALAAPRPVDDQVGGGQRLRTLPA